MDKENGKSIEDMLRLLKNKVEDSDAEGSTQSDSSSADAVLDTESLKEKLKEQYLVDNNEADSSIGAEYAIDEDFIASVADELEEAENSDKILTEAEIDSELLKEDELDEEDTSVEEESFDEESFFEDEFSSTVLYADDVIEQLSEESEPDDESLFFIDEIEDDAAIVPEPVYEDVKEEDAPDSDFLVKDADDDDDLPWFEDGETDPAANKMLNDTEATNLSFSEEEQSLPVQELTFDANEEDALEGLLENALTEEFSEEVVEEVVEEIYEDSLIEASEEAYEDISENAEDDELSFYRTITDAEHETMARIAAMRESEEDEKELAEAERIRYDFENGEALGVEEKDDAADAEETSEFNIHEALEKKYGIAADFYGSNEGFAAAQLNSKDEADDESAQESNSQKIAKVSLWYITKPIFMGIIALFIFLLELLPIFDIAPGGLLDYTVYPAIYVLVDLQLVLFISALCANKLIDGFNRILGHTPNTYSILLVTAALTVIYDIIICFCTADGLPNLYGSIVAFYILIAQVIDILDRRRVNRSLSSLLMGDGVYTLARSQGKNSCADKMYAGGVAPDTNIYEPREIKGTGYVRAFNKDREYNTDKSVSYAITPVFIFSALMAVSAMVLGEEFKTVLSSMLVSFIALAPLSAMISHFLPIYVSYTRLYNRGCFITGHKAAQSVGDCNAMVFSDRHLFKKCDPKESGIKLYTNKHAEELLSALDAVYSAIGGPMKEVFSGASSGGRSRKVTMVRITKNGLEAVVDDRTNIILGTAYYMSRYGISTDAAGVTQTGILYAAMNSLLAAKISLNYKTEPLFEMLSQFLGDNGIETVIHTYDPAINGGYVAKCRGKLEGGYPISVVHKNKTDYYASEEPLISAGKTGVFAVSSRLKLIEIAIFCKRILKVDKMNSLVRYISFGFMAVLSAVLMITGAMPHINLIWVLLHQAILIAAFSLISLKILPQSFEEIK